MTEGESPQTVFRALASSLRTTGSDLHARLLEETLDGVWTTSSELIAALGAVVLRIRAECGGLTPVQKRLVRECLGQVRRTWPGFGRWIWLRWRA